MSLLLHCGGEAVTRETLAAVPVPQATATHNPIPYPKIIDHVYERIDTLLGVEVKTESYGLAHKGQQMFAILTLNSEQLAFDACIGLRQSLNKSLALGYVGGARVFVCDNLAFNGATARYVRRNTKNCWRDFTVMLDEALMATWADFDAMCGDFQVLEAIDCDTQRGYELLGRFVGEGNVPWSQARKAMLAWQTPPHQEFAARNLYTLYQAVTEALKSGSVSDTFHRHANTHSFFRQVVEELPAETVDRALAQIEAMN